MAARKSPARGGASCISGARRGTHAGHRLNMRGLSGGPSGHLFTPAPSGALLINCSATLRMRGGASCGAGTHGDIAAILRHWRGTNPHDVWLSLLPGSKAKAWRIGMTVTGIILALGFALGYA